jgi:carbon-monoxide dehydrogenase small subunit
VRLPLTVNCRPVEAEGEPSQHLADFLCDQLALRGAHLGCEHGVCGVRTVLVSGEPARSCLMLAVQADGTEITTAEAPSGSTCLSTSTCSMAPTLGAPAARKSVA